MARFDASIVRGLFTMEIPGVLVWAAPPKNHQELAGAVAGTETRGHSGKSYRLVQVLGRKMRRSHLVFAFVSGRWPTGQIDHIDGDSLNDRPSNLREATPTQNAWNHKKRSKSSLLPMGVRRSASGKFVARIGVNGRQITIGTFPSVDAARSAYVGARSAFFGEFA